MEHLPTTTYESRSRSTQQKMKELNKKNKFMHRLGPGGYKVAMPKWTKKEQELRAAGILDPLEGCTLHTKNFICGRSHMDDNGQLITSSSEVTEVIKKAKTLVDKEKTGEFTLQCEKDQLSVALESEEHQGRTRAISSIASWKEGFMEDRHMYKKHKSHDEDVHHARINEDVAQQFFNFMRKNPQYVVQVHVLEINLDVDGVVQPFTSSSAGSAPDNQKYLVDDIKEAIACTLIYVKGRTLRTIEVADTIVLYGHIFHSRSVPSECVVIKVTTIRKGHEFEDLNYPNEEEGIEELKDAKGNFILWPPQRYNSKNSFLNNCFTSEQRGRWYSYFKHSTAF
jgi:hypothetical protein